MGRGLGGALFSLCTVWGALWEGIPAEGSRREGAAGPEGGQGRAHPHRDGPKPPRFGDGLGLGSQCHGQQPALGPPHSTPGPHWVCRTGPVLTFPFPPSQAGPSLCGTFLGAAVDALKLSQTQTAPGRAEELKLAECPRQRPPGALFRFALNFHLFYL